MDFNFEEGAVSRASGSQGKGGGGARGAVGLLLPGKRGGCDMDSARPARRRKGDYNGGFIFIQKKGRTTVLYSRDSFVDYAKKKKGALCHGKHLRCITRTVEREGGGFSRRRSHELGSQIWYGERECPLTSGREKKKGDVFVSRGRLA